MGGVVFERLTGTSGLYYSEPENKTPQFTEKNKQTNTSEEKLE